MAHSPLGTALQRARFLAPGDKLGKHDLIRQIAVGGMAELYLARTVGIEGFEKLVVVKRILPQYADNSSFVNMFLNEARLAATLHHPNIAQVYDIGQEQGEFFFSMEYVHGEDLGHLVASGTDHGVPVSLDAALTLVAGLCAGLHHAHEKASPEGKALNVVHRDVSPSNVLVSYDGAVKLVDFGIARVNSTPTSTHGGLKGKIAYMSPEQCRGKVALDRRSDIFSVGTILYELTTGQLPFTDETEYGILNQIVNRDADPPSKIVPSYPPALEAIVMRALARDPDQRYKTALELQGQVEDFAHENRLRVSPLVLARLMSTLFPARLEEWDHARAQGAFFVEQHVVRTLIESGKTGESSELSQADDQEIPQVAHLPPVAGETAPPPEDDDTAVTQPPVPEEDRPTSIRTPLLPGLPTPHAPQRTPVPQQRMPTPVSATPVPRMPTPVSATQVPRMSTPVSALPYAATPVAPTQAARMPTPVSALPPAPIHYPQPTPVPNTDTIPGVVGTAVTARLVGEEAAPYAPPTRLPTPGPRVASPVPGMPGAVPIYVPLPAPMPGTLVSYPGGQPVIAHHIGDVTERVRVPDAPAFARRKKRPALILVLAIVGAATAAGVTYFVLSRDPGPTVLATAPPEPERVTIEPVKPAVPDEITIEPEPKPAAVPVKAEPPAAKADPDPEPDPIVVKPEPIKAVVKVEPKPKPTPKTVPKPDPVKTAIKTDPVKPAIKTDPIKPAIKAEPKPKPKPPAKAKPKPEPKKVEPKKPDPKPEPKEPQWNGDSPFMPVRPDKK